MAADLLHTALGTTTKRVLIATDPNGGTTVIGPVMSTAKACELAARLIAAGFTVTHAPAPIHSCAEFTTHEKGPAAQLPTHHNGQPIRDVNLPERTA